MSEIYHVSSSSRELSAIKVELPKKDEVKLVYRSESQALKLSNIDIEADGSPKKSPLSRSSLQSKIAGWCFNVKS